MTTVPKFKPNELVDIAIRAARIRSTDDAGWLYIGDNDEIVVDPAAPGVTVTRVAPKEWPPLAGDVWRDRDGVKWFAFRDPRGFVAMKPSCPTEDRAPSPETVMAQLGPLTLHDRDGWAPQPVPAADEPAEVDERAGFIAGLRELADLAESRPDLTPTLVELSGRVGGQAEINAMASILGTDATSSVAETGKVHHNARGNLAGLPVRFWWIDPVIEAGQVDAAEAGVIAADAEQTVAAVVERT